VRREDLDAAVRVCPGKESATISPLRDDDWVAVRVMTESHDVNRVMDALEATGAKAIIVTRIHAARV
jgi:ATP phosphoribosyltransferase